MASINTSNVQPCQCFTILDPSLNAHLSSGAFQQRSCFFSYMRRRHCATLRLSNLTRQSKPTSPGFLGAHSHEPRISQSSSFVTSAPFLKLHITMPQKRAKTGCFSCRKRRVKCDEAKPECQRCKSANVHCEGYPAKKVLCVNGPERMLKRRLSSYSEGPLDIGNDALLNAGNVALPFYHQFITQTVYAISGGTRQQFWREDVARMAWSTDYVYHAMISLAAMHKSSTDASGGRPPAALRTFALQNYQQAIKLLSRDSNACALKPIRVLATLTLFSYFEVCDRLAAR